MLIGTGGKMYLVDMEGIRKRMFEPMPLIMPTPPAPDRLRFFQEMDFMPKVRNSMAIISGTWDGPNLKFAYLFPLGRKAYIGTTPASKRAVRRMKREGKE